MISNVQERTLTIRGLDRGHYLLTPIGGGREAALLELWICPEPPFAALCRLANPVVRVYRGEDFDRSSLAWYGHMVAKAQLDDPHAGSPINVEVEGRTITVGIITNVDREEAAVTIVLAHSIEALHEV